MSTIRFVKPNRYRRAIGELDSQLTYGVHDTLVVRGIAEWVDQSPVTVAAISEPVLAIPQTEPHRKPRRSFKES